MMNLKVLTFLIILNQTLFGLFPVLLRYLLVKSQPEVMSVSVLLSSTRITSMILLFLIEKFVSVRKKYKQSSSSKLDTKQDNKRQKEQEREGDEGIKAEELPLIMKRSFEKLEEKEVEIKQQKYDVIVVGLMYALCSVIRALLNLSSSKYTKPYNVSMIQNAFSFLTPLVDTIFLKTRLPKSLFPAIVMSICCCCLALYAQHKQQQQLQIIENSSYDNNNDDVFTIQDLMGCLLQVLSMCFRTITDIMMKTTTDVMSGYELIQIGNLGLVILPLIISFLPPPSSSTTTHTHHNNTTVIIQHTKRVSHNGWTVFAHLSIKSFLCWLAISTLCSTIAFSMKVYLTRERSPGFYSSFAGIVTISSIFFSALILDEPIGGGIVSNNNKKDDPDMYYYYCRLEWLGILGTILSTTIYIMSISPQSSHQHRG